MNSKSKWNSNINYANDNYNNVNKSTGNYNIEFKMAIMISNIDLSNKRNVSVYAVPFELWDYQQNLKSKRVLISDSNFKSNLKIQNGSLYFSFLPSLIQNHMFKKNWSVDQIFDSSDILINIFWHFFINFGYSFNCSESVLLPEAPTLTL